jgi:hypothetical protein
LFETSCTISKMWLSAGPRGFGGDASDKVPIEIAPTKKVRKATAVDIVEVLVGDCSNWNIN